jgi:hypothetical protein
LQVDYIPADNRKSVGKLLLDLDSSTSRLAFDKPQHI